MNYKKIIILNIFLIFIFSVIYHNVYVHFPNFLTSFIFPVNESIFEHMKLIYLSYMTSGLIEYILLNKNDIDTTNLKFSIVFSIIFNIILILIVYTIIYISFGHNIVITLITYFITIIITNYLAYRVLICKNKLYIKTKTFLSISLVMLLLLSYFTYNPPKNVLFIDYQNKKIGLNNYY